MYIPNTISFENITINRVSKIKYLGVIFDEHLNWNNHIIDLCNKMKRLFPIFYNIRDFLSIEHIKIIYYTMIYSRIKYGSIVFGLTNDGNIAKIQVVQNGLLKVLSIKKVLLFNIKAS